MAATEANWKSRADWVAKRVHPQVFRKPLDERKHRWVRRYGGTALLAAFLVGTLVSFLGQPSIKSGAWVAGAGLLVGANGWIRRKTGEWENALTGATLVLREVPLELGGVLEAQLRLCAPPPREGRPRLVLHCVRRTYLPGISITRTREDTTLWRTAQPVGPEAARDDDGWYIPVHFELPLDAAAPSFERTERGRTWSITLWALELHAAPKGVPVKRIFEIPVVPPGRADAAGNFGTAIHS